MDEVMMLENTTILVVDDMEINRVILKELFQQECAVLEAENGQIALDLLEEHPEIDIVIMDIVMPVMDGFETLHAIRGNSRFSNLPVVICTEHTEVDMQVRALDLGSTDFVTKPFNARVVRHRVRNLIEVRKMEQKIAEQKRADQLRDILNSIVSPLGLFEFTGSKVHAIYLNQSIYDMFSSTKEELQAFSSNMLQSMLPEDAEQLVDLFKQNQEDGTPVDITYRVPQKDGSLSMLELHALSIRYEHFENPVYLASITDITHQRRTEVALRDTDQRLKSLINAIPGAILTLELSSPMKITYFNDTVCEILNLSRAEFQARSQDVLSLVYEPDQALVEAIIRNFMANPEPFGETFRIKRKGDGLRWIRMSGAPIITAEGTLLCNCVCIDVSVEKESELKLEQAFKEMQYRSEHDRLTGIWNRETFNQKTHEYLTAHPEDHYVLLAMNIQRFKVINELFGASVGDEVLRTLSRALERMFGGIGTCGRMEADHFMACFPTAHLDMEQIIAELDQVLKMQYSDYRIELFFGIYEIHNIHVAVDQMCDRATMALKTVKGSAVKRFAFYDDTMRKNLLEEQEIIEEMHDALAQGQFIPYLQPIYGLNSLKPVSAEVLVRWKHPVKGLIPPGVFVPLFERNGFITKLDFSIWEQACQLLHKWKTQGAPLVPVSINISRIDLYHPHLCEDLLALLQKYDLDVSLLKLEITESAYIDDPDVLPSVLKRFRAAGFQILMDDFGSGYSSLNTLKDMPINIMKIDMCFLAELEGSPRAASILTSVVRMAKWLDLPVVVEGVETKAQLDFLQSVGCDMGQGYYFSKPLCVEDFEKLLDTVKTATLSPKSNALGQVDVDLLWNSSTEVNQMFNSMIGGMAIFELTGHELKVQRVSDAYYHVVNCKPQEAFSLGMRYLRENDRKLVVETCQKALLSNRAELITVRRQEGDGPASWLEYRIRHLSTDGDTSTFFFIANDVTAQKEMELTRSLGQYTQILRNVYYRIFELNFTKDRFSEIYRADGEGLRKPCSFSEAGASYLKQVHPEDQAFFRKACHADFLKQIIHESTSAKIYNAELRAKNSEGHYHWIACTFIQLDDLDGEDAFLLCLSDANTHAYDLASRELQWQQEHFRLLAECTNSLTFDYDVDSDTMTLHFHPQGETPHNYAIEKHLTKLAESTILPDNFKALYAKALQNACVKPTEASLEFPASFESEPYHWCRVDYSSLADAKGHVFRIVGRILDISREKQAEELLRMEQQYRKAFLSETLFVCDVEPNVDRYELLHQAEDAEERFFPYTHYLYLEKDFFHPDDLPQLKTLLSGAHLQRLYAAKEDEFRLQARIKDRKDQWVWVEAALHLLESSDANSPRFLLYMKVVDHQKRTEAELRTRAETDSISALYNRGAMQEHIIQRLAGSPEEAHAFFLLDIDNFKQINDTFGHAVGDEVIQSIANVLRKLFRSSDLTGRLGGDEFAAFMSYHPSLGEQAVRHKALKAVDSIHKIVLEGHEGLHPTVSLGVAIAPQDGIVFESLYQNADKALYSVKKHGKNGFALYGDLKPPAKG